MIAREPSGSVRPQCSAPAWASNDGDGDRCALVWNKIEPIG